MYWLEATFLLQPVSPLTIYQNVRQRHSFRSNLTFWECQRITYTSWVTFQKLAFENSSLKQLILGSSNINALKAPLVSCFFLVSVKAKQRWSIKCLLNFYIKDKNKRWRIFSTSSSWNWTNKKPRKKTTGFLI